MTSRRVSRARALRKAFARQWRRVRANPSLLPHFAGKAWRILRGGRLDKLIERNRMRTDWFSDYSAWAAEHDTRSQFHFALLGERIAALPHAPRFALVVVEEEDARPGARTETLAALEAQVHRPVAVEPVRDEASALTALARLALRGDVDYLGALSAGDVLAPDALAELALELGAAPSTVLAYVDHDELLSDGSRANPDFKPCWDPFLFAQEPYFMRTAVARRDAVAAAFTGAAPDSEWDLLWRIAEAAAPHTIAHLPRVLIHRAHLPRSDGKAPRPAHRHFERLGTRPEYEPLTPRTWRLRLPLPQPAPQVTVIIPTRDQPDLLAAAVDGVLTRTAYPHLELIVVDNGSELPQTHALLARLESTPRVRVLRDPAPFNFARLNNLAVKFATGRVLCFLNDDTNVIVPDWLDEMTALALQPEVGVVGARLLYGDGTIQHAGVLLGAFALTHHLLQGRPADFRGYRNRGLLTHAVSAVTAACAVIRRDLFDALGGFDEALPAAYNDVDLCLAAGARGRYNVVVNRPLVHHFESASRGYYLRPEQEAADRAALHYLIGKWGDGVRADPFYNPNLALDRENYTLAYPPRVPAENAFRFPFVRTPPGAK
ncbi:MAG: glycosyltransferase [Casimicrobiaceae bacterium]